MSKSNRGRQLRGASSIGTLTLVLAATSGYAQTAPAPTSSSNDELQEIVVTAQKRAQKLSDVGMAITAASGEQLTERGIDDVAALTALEPSFQVSKSQLGTNVFTIRGIGYSTNRSRPLRPLASIRMKLAIAIPL